MALEMQSPDLSPETRAYILKEWGVEVPLNEAKETKKKKKKKKKHDTEDIIAEKKKNFNRAMMKHTISFGIGYCVLSTALFLSIQFPDLVHISEWMINTLQPFIGFSKCLIIMITISSLFSLYKSDIDSMQRNRFVFSFVSGITEGVGIASISCITTDIIVNLLSSGVIL